MTRTEVLIMACFFLLLANIIVIDKEVGDLGYIIGLIAVTFGVILAGIYVFIKK